MLRQRRGGRANGQHGGTSVVAAVAVHFVLALVALHLTSRLPPRPAPEPRLPMPPYVRVFEGPDAGAPSPVRQRPRTEKTTDAPRPPRAEPPEIPAVTPPDAPVAGDEAVTGDEGPSTPGTDAGPAGPDGGPGGGSGPGGGDPAGPAGPTAAPEWVSSKPMVLSDRVTPPTLLRKVEPEFSAVARRYVRNGRVKLRCIVQEDGRVRVLDVVVGHPMLDAACVKAVQQWLYEPAVYQGHPQAVFLTVTIELQTR
jgi:TonB family protein